MTLQTLDLAGRVDAVATGRDGRLFLARGEGFDAQTLFGAPYTDDAGLERSWRVGLERRKRLCAEVGAAFVVLIAPEAHGVHEEQLPDGLAYATPSIGDRFAALARSMGITVVWPREALRAARGPVEVYRRDDSHWTAYGAAIAYLELMAALPGDLARGRLDPDTLAFGWEETLGDLAWIEPQARRRPNPSAMIDRGRSQVVASLSNERRHALKITQIADASLPSAVIFRDSAATAMAPFLMESFRRTVLIGSAERAYLEIVAEERPDVVVLERSERSLLNGVIDWGMETWREAFPADDGDPTAHEAEIAARSALLGGDIAAAVAEADAAIAVAPTIERLILAGRARLAAGDAVGAARVLQPAVDDAPGRWTGLLHLGTARLAQGDFTLARDLFARCCAVAPWNPIGFEHFGYASLHSGDAAGAIPALRTAVRLGPEYSGAHVWLVEALTRTGDLAGAKLALHEGLRLHPADPLLCAYADAQLRPN